MSGQRQLSMRNHRTAAVTLSLLAIALAPSGALAKEQDTGGSAPLTLRSMTPEQGAGGSALRLELSRPARFSVFKLSAPTRVVIDIAECDVSAIQGMLRVDDGRLTRVMTTRYSNDNGVIGRVMVGIEDDLAYDVKAEGAAIVLSVRGGELSQAKAVPATARDLQAAATNGSAIESAQAAAPARSAVPAPVAAPAPAPAPGPSGPSLTDVSFTKNSGKGVLTLAMDDAVAYRVSRIDERTLALTLPGLALPADLRKSFDTSAFDTPVRSVEVDTTGGGEAVRARVVVDEKVHYEVRRKGQQVRWTFEGNGQKLAPASVAAAPSAPAPVAAAAPAAPAMDFGQNDLDESPAASAGIESEPGAVAGFASEATSLIDAVPARRRYSGKRISLDLKDADIHNVLRLIADVSRLNVITSDDVSGTVTIRLVNVPWDQALDIILKAKGLGQERHGNIIRVAPLEVLASEREIALKQREALKELDPLQVRLLPVNYATAGNLVNQVTNVLSTRGEVQVDERTNVLIIKDVLDSLIKAEQLVKQLDTETPQVLIEARIIEARRNFREEIGIQWGGGASVLPANGDSTGLAFPNYFSLAGGSPSVVTPAGLAGAPNFAVNLPAAVSEGAGGAIGLSLGSIGGAANLNLRLSALENTGKVRIISSPKIATLDNRPASIKQGIRIPVSTVSALGTQTKLVEAVLLLEVTPHITPEGGIILRMNLKRDEPDFSRRDIFGQPAILTTESQTELLIKDGDTSVIGGIFSRVSTQEVNQIPVLGDIPILGWLFKRRATSDDRTELLIFITPRILNRAQALITPQ